MHIQDAADCYIFTLTNFDKMKGNIFNAGGEHLNYSKLEVAQLIKDKVDYKIIESEVKDKDLRHYYVKFDKIKKLGFVPKISVEEGIDELVKVYEFYEYYSHFKII